MKTTLSIILCIAIQTLNAQAQEVSFDRVAFPVQAGETVGEISFSLSAGDRRIAQVQYRKEDGTTSRTAFVGIKGTDAQELFDPYRDAQAPFFTGISPKRYKNKALITIQNVGPGGIDSIWVTDGTTAGTSEIAQVDPGAIPFIIINDTLVLITENTAIKFLDLVSGSVTHIADGLPSGSGSYSFLGEFADGRALFAAGLSVYASDGTLAGTQVITTLSDPYSYYLPTYGINSADKTDASPLRVFGLSFGYNSVRTTFVTDGTAAGTRKIPTAAFQPGSSGDIQGVQVGSKFIYANTTTEHGRELWSLDLVTLQASLLKDINPGGSDGCLRTSLLHVVNRKVFFVGNDGIHGDELWVSDGTATGTALTKDIAPGSLSGVSTFDYNSPQHPSVGKFFLFTAHLPAKDGDPNIARPGKSFWASDGTAEGTFQLADWPPYGNYGSTAINDDGVLVFPSVESFGITVPEEATKWHKGVFLRFFDPNLGPPTSAYLVTVAGSNQPISAAYRLTMAGDYYYIDTDGSENGSSIVLSAPRQLCPGSDFKPIPGQCGCGVEELAADPSGGIVQSNEDSDGSVICMTPIGPIFIPATVSGQISGKLSQGAGQADSVQLAIPASFLNALQLVTTAPNLNISAQSVVSTQAASKFKAQHGVSVVIIDKRNKSVKKLPLRKTSTGTLKVKLGRRLTAHQQLTFQYAVGATRGGQQLIQTPYKKSGAIKLTKARR